MRRRIVPRIGVPVLLGVGLFLSSGCVHPQFYVPRSPGSSYLSQRLDDLLDVGDFGFTFSLKPGFALYYDLTPFVPIGFSYVDGYFLGLGGGKIGFMRHYQRNLGFIVYGEEAVGFGNFDPDDPETVNFQRAGVLGIITGLFSGSFPRPDYLPTCLHYVHVGFVGAVANLRYLQAVDFVLGWTTLDIAFDDGRERGRWFSKPLIGVAPVALAPAQKGERVAAPAAGEGTGENSGEPVAVEWPADSARNVAEKAAVPPKRSARDLVPPPLPDRTAPPPRPRTRTYVVKPGDMGLVQIAREQLRDAAKWKLIVELNHLKPPYMIRVGQRLLLPE